ncbi:MAG: hypothetical protein QW331_03580, partial [Candidatus Woesearchaeota archaeon]
PSLVHLCSLSARKWIGKARKQYWKQYVGSRKVFISYLYCLSNQEVLFITKKKGKKIKRTSTKVKKVKKKLVKKITKQLKHKVKYHKPTKPKSIKIAKAVMKKVPEECGECGSVEIVHSQLMSQVICKTCGAITPY